MAWVETDSLSFSARHESEESDAVEATLERLEELRERLDRLFERTPGEVEVVVHSQPFALAIAHPWLPLARMLAAPAARRYMAGWFTRDEIHVLSPAALAARASRVEGSREALLLSPLHEYAHLVVGANNPELPPPFTPRSFGRYARWAWLCEGAAVHFSTQGRHLRAAIARRLREGGRPEFPPSTRDAPLLGGTVFALLERDAGAAACVELATRLHPGGGRAAIERAFGRPASDVERDWRRYLDGIPAAG